MQYPSGRTRGLPAALIEELVEHRRDHLRDIVTAISQG
jgi:hypothetical protein